MQWKSSLASGWNGTSSSGGLRKADEVQEVCRTTLVVQGLHEHLVVLPDVNKGVPV